MRRTLAVGIAALAAVGSAHAAQSPAPIEVFVSVEAANGVPLEGLTAEDFEAVAKRLSQDPGAQTNGGDLGWFRPDIFVDHHFSDAVVALKKGQYTKTPVRTRFGWHVVKVEDGPRAVANAERYKELDDSAREALRQRTAQLRIEEVTQRLSEKAKVASPSGNAAAVARAAK